MPPARPASPRDWLRKANATCLRHCPGSVGRERLRPSAGFGEKEKIYGKVELSLKKIESQAYKKSQEIRGQAEADAVRVYAEALNLDPEYYEFVRTLQMYENIFKTNSKLILSTDSHFLELLKKGFITSG